MRGRKGDPASMSSLNTRASTGSVLRLLEGGGTQGTGRREARWV